VIIIVIIIIIINKFEFFLKKTHKFDLNGKIKNYKNFEKKNQGKKKEIKSRKTKFKSIVNLTCLSDPTKKGLACLLGL
jgi:hypothetical protein